MSVLLIQPPQWVTNMPPLAIPTLSGFLKRKGVRCQAVDLNIKMYRSILSSSQLNAIIAEGNHIQSREFAEFIASSIDGVLTSFQGHSLENDLEKQRFCHSIIGSALEIFSQSKSPFCVSRMGMSFGKSVSNMTEILAIANDPPPWLAEFFSRELSRIDMAEIELIGLSVSSLNQFICSLIISKMIRHREIPLVLGGSFLTARVRELLLSPEIFDVVDYLAIREGEPAIEDLLSHLSGNLQLDKCRNLLFRLDGEVKVSEGVGEAYEGFEIPDFSVFDLRDYFSPEPILSIQVSRGCYGSCSFCSYRSHSARWQENSGERVLESVKEMMAATGSKKFFFASAAMSPRLARSLSSAILAENLRVFWSTGLRMETEFSPLLCKMMADSGCRRVDFGMESASSRVLSRMNKRVDPADLERIVRSFSDAGIMPFLYLIRNFPSETIEEWKSTITFLRRNSEYILGAAIYDFFVSDGSPVADNPEDYGLVCGTHVEEQFVVQRTFIKSGGPTAEVVRAKSDMTKEFLSNFAFLFDRSGDAFVSRQLPQSLEFQLQSSLASGRFKKADISALDSDDAKLCVLHDEIDILREEYGNLRLLNMRTGTSVIMRKSVAKLIMGFNAEFSIRDLFSKFSAGISDNDRNLIIGTLSKLIQNYIIAIK